MNQQIAEFHKAYPDIELSIHFSDSRDDLIAEGFDLALRVGAMEDSSLKAKKVAQIFRKLVAAPSLFDAIAYPKSPDELKKFSWVQLNQLSRKRTITHVSGEKQTLKTLGKLCVDNVEAMCQFCVAGLGLATPPDYLVEHYIKDRTLVELLPDWQVEPIPVYAVWPQNISDSSNAKRLINFLN
ncbi:substrate binding domain-containing protein [Litoribacillus peritrichatus]|uniref:LysR substrate-binding domain-containing protein n=1 Tax=Litoribacillus peritrichatus TaxID=718191 RepID=A0ABP7MA79_9GAMM